MNTHLVTLTITFTLKQGDLFKYMYSHVNIYMHILSSIKKKLKQKYITAHRLANLSNILVAIIIQNQGKKNPFLK